MYILPATRQCLRNDLCATSVCYKLQHLPSRLDITCKSTIQDTETSFLPDCKKKTWYNIELRNTEILNIFRNHLTVQYVQKEVIIRHT